MKVLIKTLSLVLLLMLVTVPAYTQGPGFDDDVVDEDVPLDGGITLLAAAGIGYGIKKLRVKKNE